jgi:nucleotide-binding universal stress UspA family protein
MNVLIGVDGSDGGYAAAALAGRLLDAARDRLAFYCAPPEMAPRSSDPPEPQTAADLQSLLAHAVFQEAQRRLPAAWQGQARTIARSENPIRGLLRAAEESEAELIVLGARGRGSSEKGGIGSVVQGVVHEMNLPVLVARAPRSGTVEATMRVLLASDGSLFSRLAADFLHGFTWPPKSQGRVMYAIDPHRSDRLPSWLEEQFCEQEAERLQIGHFRRSETEQQLFRKQVTRWCGELPTIFDDRDPLAAKGPPADKILQVIEAEAIDLVVVGARGLHGVRRLWLGSTSERLLHEAPCSVLIVR